MYLIEKGHPVSMGETELPVDVLPPHTRDFSREIGGRAFYLQGLNLYGIN